MSSSQIKCTYVFIAERCLYENMLDVLKHRVTSSEECTLFLPCIKAHCLYIYTFTTYPGIKRHTEVHITANKAARTSRLKTSLRSTDRRARRTMEPRLLASARELPFVPAALVHVLEDPGLVDATGLVVAEAPTTTALLHLHAMAAVDVWGEEG